MWNNEWIKGVDYPEWGDNEVYKKTIGGGYLYNEETPKEAYERVSKTVARRLQKPEMADSFFNYIWKGWLCCCESVCIYFPPILSWIGWSKMASGYF